MDAMVDHHSAGLARRLVTGLFVVCTLHALPASTHAAQGFDPRAMEVLRVMSTTLAGASQITARSMNLYDIVQPGGIAIKIAQEVHIQLKRPNKLNVRVRRDDGFRRFLWFDGETATVYDPVTNTYFVVDVPGTLDNMFRVFSDKYLVEVPMSDLLVADPYAAFEEYLISAAYIGKRSIDGIEVHHLSFESRGADFQLWVTADARALPLRFAITYPTVPGEPGFLANIRDWRLAPYVDDGAFMFHAPEGAKQVPLRMADQ